ncbi:hypothetical protein D3C79_912290 [compost metagenome]
MLQEQPLVLAALGIALGAALGAALPGTRKEDELMGASSDRLTDALKTKGSELKTSVEESMDQAGGNASPRVERKPEGTDLSDGLGFAP